MKKLIMDCLSEQMRSVLYENGQITEIIIEEKKRKAAAGSICTGRIEKVLSGGFAFINIGDEKNAFLQLKKEDKLKEGDSIIVQVTKEAYGEKGANVTQELSFSGRYAVVTTDSKPIGISAKITSDERRGVLKKIAEEHLQNFSGIIRTNSKNTPDEIIIAELKALTSVAKKITDKGMYAKPPFELLRGFTEAEKIVRDYLTDSGDTVIVNCPEIYENIKERFPHIKAELYTKNIPILSYYMAENQIEKAMHKKVWLKSGGFLIIEPTEAMTVIDVNSGKFSGKNREQTILKTNLEAVDEIAYQIRLRNLSGMIIVDFIDMQNKDENDKIYMKLKEVLKKDRIKTVVVGMTELGLMQITRQKIHRPLHSILKCTCSCCNGSGMVDSPEYALSKIKNHIQSIFTETIYKNIRVSAGEKLVRILKNDGFAEIFREKFGGCVEFKIINTAVWDYYEIEYVK